MIAELTFWGFVWYYFNIIAITGIIFFLLMIALNRSKRTVINIGEQSAQQNQAPMFLKFVMYMSVFGIIFFACLEWGDDIYEMTEPIRDYVGDKIDS